ncbi:MAG TPA: heat-inducible transcriptional repressor HrcA [Candidatus Binataceae bacterium]|nr:heat-inducible transcriptional repressor HrcA [Candidatus Binataceae bacterium]
MESSSKELSQRQHALLLAAVEEFIASAEPVGSQHLAQHRSLGVRAAMVRNLMGELEEAGFLTQPHTSAGRIPTERAFRYYVDHLAAPIPFSDRAQIELHYSAPPLDLNGVIRDTSRLLALMTGQAALVTAPRPLAVTIERVQFIRLRERQVLAVFVAAAGPIENRLVAADQDYQQAELDRMAAYLNESLAGRTLEQAREWIEKSLREDRANYDRFMRAALTLGGAVTRIGATAEVYVEGSLKALEQPEFADRDKLRELLRALEDKTALLDLLERTLRQSGAIVSIGAENVDARLAGFSVIAASYASGTTPLGSLAVLGPTRMDYERVIPLVTYTAKALSRVLDH